ncbi:MAG: hypothetical protein ACFE9N_09375 [Promethearchaeota archaeon]
MSEIILCSACGFSFRVQNANKEENKIVCPMCGQKFVDSNILPFTSREFDNKF